MRNLQVIRALYDYEAQQSQELSFSRGDFFHVIGRENDTDWYEACNPALPDARGLVPVAFFQALGRTERDSAQSDSGPRTSAGSKIPDHDSGYADSNAPPMSPPPAAVTSPVSPAAGNVPSHRISKSIGKTGSMVYGIVMYDFQAERPDELEAKAGEAIIVIAQSNPEWFVAKPIGRLGGPGLIPVSFIEIRDMGTDKAVPNPGDAIKRAGVPRVEEWKKMTAEYKNSSITLGKFDAGGAPGAQQGAEQGMERLSLQQQALVRQSQQQPGYPQVCTMSTISYSWLIYANVHDTSSHNNKARNNNSATHSSRSPVSNMVFGLHLIFWRLWRHAYQDTVSQRTSIGSWLKRHSKTAGSGSCHGTTKTFTTSRLRS